MSPWHPLWDPELQQFAVQGQPVFVNGRHEIAVIDDRLRTQTNEAAGATPSMISSIGRPNSNPDTHDRWEILQHALAFMEDPNYSVLFTGAVCMTPILEEFGGLTREAEAVIKVVRPAARRLQVPRYGPSRRWVPGFIHGEPALLEDFDYVTGT